jgi:mono/diheme cytochrome c family protein
MKITVSALWALAACSSRTSTGFQIASATGRELASAVAGDAIALALVETFSDGTTEVVPGATWTAPTTVMPRPPDASPLPALATAIFVDNTLRTDRPDDLGGVLFVLDAGSATLTASAGAASATRTIPIATAPAGDATHGQVMFAAACAACHGTMAQGSAPQNADGTYTIDGLAYAFPAPGLGRAMGNLASDPAWSAALLAYAARADIDDGGVVLRYPMPDWLSEPVAGALVTTTDFADIYAFLQTQ